MQQAAYKITEDFQQRQSKWIVLSFVKHISSTLLPNFHLTLIYYDKPIVCLNLRPSRMVLAGNCVLMSLAHVCPTITVNRELRLLCVVCEQHRLAVTMSEKV